MEVDLSIFISCFNEQETIVPTIISLISALKNYRFRMRF